MKPEVEKRKNIIQFTSVLNEENISDWGCMKKCNAK